MREQSIAYTPYAIVDAYGPFGRFLLGVTKYFAIAGGLIFVALVIMSVISIVGRKLFAFVVPGDVEILQMSAAVAASTFFAHCHLMHGDVKVDFFTHSWAPRKVALLDACSSLLVALFGALIAWRTWVGAMSLREVGETSAILAWPVWVAQALMVPSFVLLAIAGLYSTVHLLRLAAWRFS